MRSYILLLIGFLSIFSIKAKEQGFILRGSVVRSDSIQRTPLDSVYINISAANDTSTIRFKILQGDDATKTNAADGSFRVMVYGNPGKYILTLDREGFEPVMKEVEQRYKDQTAVWVGSISMRPERNIELNEVEIVQTAIKVVLKGDTIVYNADAFNLAEGSMLNALVKQLPGAELTSDGRIKVNGRFVSNLLLNGKDFFKDDPTVALDNLPAYAVKNVKVYDKAGEDDYLTRASQKLDQNENDENIVMDIVLKKEYSTSWMASAEAGYGTAERWLGKAFGLGFTEKFRLTAFVNANNLMDNTTASTDGNWSQSWGEQGEMDMQTGGIEYLYDDNKRWKINGNITHSHEDHLMTSQNASTNYYSTGNLYSRTSREYTSDRQNLRTRHNIQFKGDDIFLTIQPNIDWRSTDDYDTNLSATFNEKPDETTRVEALDSVFRYKVSERYNKILLSRLKQINHSFSSTFAANLSASAQIRTKKMRGSLRVGLDGGYANHPLRGRSVYIQNYGGANLNQTDPIRTDRYTTSPRSNYFFSPSASYNQKWTRLSEVYSDELNFNVGASYRQTHSENPYDIFESALLPDETDPTMSLEKPENAIKMLMNSRRSLTHQNEVNASVGLTLSREPVAPTDSGFNPSYYLNLSLQEQLQHEYLDYSNADDFHQKLRRTRNNLRPTVDLSLRSSNKSRQLTFGLNYSTYNSAPALSGFLDVPNTDNPVYINIKNPNELKDMRSNFFRVSFMRFGRGEGRSVTYFYLNCTLEQNALGSYTVFNPETGVTRNKTVNINGNYGLGAYANHDFSIGPRKEWNLGASLHLNNNHNVGYYVASTDPDAEAIRTGTDWISLGGDIFAGYTFKNGSNITLRPGTDWRNSQSDRADVKAINTMSYHVELDAKIELPWQMQFTTHLGAQFNHGYESKAANRTNVPWDATLSKSILKGDLTFKLSAHDILNLQPVHYAYSTALSYTETWQNRLPRYAMLSAIYRFRSLSKQK